MFAGTNRVEKSGKSIDFPAGDRRFSPVAGDEPGNSTDSSVMAEDGCMKRIVKPM
jgi:hypothetical protein